LDLYQDETLKTNFFQKIFRTKEEFSILS